MWFANQNDQVLKSLNSFETKATMENYPPKPTKLTPLYSKKRSEITNIDDSLFSKKKVSPVNEETKKYLREKSKLELIGTDLNDSLNLSEEKKTKKKKTKKKESSIIKSSNDNIETVETIETNIPSTINEIKSEDLNVFNGLNESTEQTPVNNSIESIWSTNLLQPRIDDSFNLGTINEEYPESSTFNRTRVLGARKVKTPAPDFQADNEYNRDNSEISLKFNAKRNKSDDFFKSLNHQSSLEDDDDNIILVDEFNRENQPSSSSSSNLNRRSSAFNKND